MFTSFRYKAKSTVSFVFEIQNKAINKFSVCCNAFEQLTSNRHFFNMFPKNANKQLDNAFFIEMLDVFINSILYLREVYPAAIFQKRKFFDTAVYISSFKPLNSYLEKVLKTAEELKDKNELRGVEVTLYKLTNPDKDMTDETVLEKYVIHVYKTKRNDRFNKFDEVMSLNERRKTNRNRFLKQSIVFFTVQERGRISTGST